MPIGVRRARGALVLDLGDPVHARVPPLRRDGLVHYAPPHGPDAWVSLPCVARVVLGKAFGRRAVLTAMDEAERFVIVDVDRGVESEVRGVTAVCSGGFGPVFLADT